ncbi:Glucan endo-1,3-beta-glucosidase BG4 precursor [Actinidia chinensis var. chinensis]|uniref:Glucan endo-1,3-beta-glucosidase BG4 n=1 Tax=Actinidia chinensis var. chinensis TaxID=1590841 RepID=A0A2R6QYV8_ACTCC|nr:Glucan endo-1,3-beta-glucosidase BG4 precursor [Actinidia chinensis var. chinensis]
MMVLKRDRFMVVPKIVLVTTQLLLFAGAVNIGVDYGRLGNNLPSPRDVISLYKRCGINSLRLYDPKPEVLEALRGSNLRVSLGVRNEDIESLATNPAAANQWVNTNIVPYKNNVNFVWITIGNEVIPGPYASNVPAAMINIYNAIRSIGLSNTKRGFSSPINEDDNHDGGLRSQVPVPNPLAALPAATQRAKPFPPFPWVAKVTTVTAMILASSYPPSSGAFTGETIEVMRNVVAFLQRTGAPIMVNVYPYFAYASDPADISLEYATFRAQKPIMDGKLKYYSLFDAMVDAYYAAMTKINASNISIIVSETGWPTAGNSPYTSVEIAQTYNMNLINHVRKQGTPRWPANQITDAFIFAMFNENEKPNGIEQNWGLFYPSMKRVYQLFQTC